MIIIIGIMEIIMLTKMQVIPEIFYQLFLIYLILLLKEIFLLIIIIKIVKTIHLHPPIPIIIKVAMDSLQIY